jgi:hypothetical protein
MWVARYLFKVKSSSGAGAVRGIASEFVLANKYKEGKFDYDLLNMKFMTLCTESMIDLGDAKTEKERGLLKRFGEVIDNNFDYENLEDYQEKVEVQLDDLPVPIMGYIDFRFKDKIVDYSIQKFLSISDDKHELASFVYPNLDSWMWNGKMKEEAKKIWSVK